MRLSSILNSNNLMSNSNNTNRSNGNCTIISSYSVNNSNNSRKTTTTSTINSGNSNCINIQNININVQDMGLFPCSDRSRSLQVYQDLYFSQANMYLNALQKQSLGMYYVYCGQSQHHHSMGRNMYYGHANHFFHPALAASAMN